MKASFFDNFKKRVCTGALVVTMFTTLTGCGIIPGPVDILKAYVELENAETNTNEEYDENQITTNSNINYTNTTQAGESYNKYLYDNISFSLDQAVDPNSIIFQESKETDNADRRITIGEYEEQIIVLPEDECNEFVKWVRNQDVVYVYADLYNVDTALTEAAKYNTATHTYGDFICDLNVIPSVDLIYTIIKENNINTLKQNSGYEILPDEELKLIAQLLHEDLKVLREKVTEEELKRIYSMLNDISAVGIDSSDFTVNELRQQYNARVLENGTIIIDLNNIALLRGENAKLKTYDHEIMHLFQRMCPDNQIEGYYQIGGSQYFDDLEINSLHWNWYYEASSELSVMNKYQTTDPLVYKTMVGYLKSLDMLTLLQSEYGHTTIEDSSFSTDPNRIYEIFGTTTEEEKKEIINMLFSTDFIQIARDDFLESYENEYSKEANIDEIKFTMKKSVCQTLTKYFYINLAQEIKKGNISLQDVFYLINVWEADLSYHTDYDMPEKYEYNKEFIDKYTEIQNQFFTYIAESNNLTFEEIEKLFNDYSMIIKTSNGYERNCDLDWLNQEEREFIYNLNNTNLWAMTYNIRNITEVLNKNLGR